MADLFTDLAAPFPPDRVSWRVGSTNKEKTRGMGLAYIDARDVMERLDAVCGPGGWQCCYPHAAAKTVCEIGVRVGTEWIWKADGAGDSDVEAEKGALSDAFKRAAVRWGIGRYLYEVPSPWVEIEAAGKSYTFTAAGKAALARALIGGKAPPAASAPQPAAAPARAPARPAKSEPVDHEGPTESEQRIYTLLTGAVGMIRTLKEMNEWRAKPDNIQLFGDLPISLRAKFQAAMSARREQLKGTEAGD